jgi:hypothetical protein
MSNRTCCILFAILLIACASFAHGQGMRWDLGAPGSAGAAISAGNGGLSTLFAQPGVALAWCNYPANAIPCTNFAPTYNSLTLAVACPSNTPIVLQGSSTCQATGDNYGNLGVFTAPNSACGVTCYAYTLTSNGVTAGPYLWTQGGGITVPILFPSTATPTSYANECAAVANSSGGTTATTPMLQVVDGGTNIAHDLMCRAANGAIIFPLSNSMGYSFGSGLPSGNRTLEVNSSTSGKNGLALTNLSATSRGNAIQFRSCVNGCGTDFILAESFANDGSEDINWTGGTGNSNLYFTGNCPTACPIKFGPLLNTNGVTQFLISDYSSDAHTHPAFGLVNGHIAHDITRLENLDAWGTVTLAGGTGTYNFNTAWSAAPLCVCNNPNQAGAAIACSASASTTVLTLKSGAGTDTVNYSCQGNPY